MKSDPLPSRRQLLGGLAGVLVSGLLAGCSDSSDSTDDASPGSDAEPETDLDLREANVVEVAFEGDSDAYTFDVTLHHDDEGEDGFANWWQVERLDGTRLGRRELRHAHAQQPFTRSETIGVPDDVTCVVVRGHDRTHGYGGQLMLVNLESTATQSVNQGSDPRPIDETDCP
ncbi:hypothetical protein [Natrinema salaciae]|uniref:Uncharacterized protein n=1 Tax=Natrinema salaciae TaxID=1186196 RepID=A0A1H9P1B4_9EURY|nr:hypothetical protein [Natrinema salaciae]SER42026.1 hypothetical protein SAMN04489841_3826 [Natrinema salaciae]